MTIHEYIILVLKFEAAIGYYTFYTAVIGIAAYVVIWLWCETHTRQLSIRTFLYNKFN